MLTEIALAAVLHQCCVTTDEAIRYQQCAERTARIESERREAETWEWYPQWQEYGVTAYYEQPNDGLNVFSGVNYHDGRTETYYSSNVLYHYRTNEWTLDDEGFYRDADGYYVVAASDMEQGATFTGSKGECKVYDCGCADGVTDYYVNW
jgi:hypothetical protein